MQKFVDKKDFEKRVYKFMLDVIKFVDLLPKDVVCRAIANQLVRSGTSVGVNYFEAKSSSSRKEFLNYFQISLKSANETTVWLMLLRDSGKCKSLAQENLIRETAELAKIFASSILTMKGKR